MSEPGAVEGLILEFLSSPSAITTVSNLHMHSAVESFAFLHHLVFQAILKIIFMLGTHKCQIPFKGHISSLHVSFLELL